MTDNSRDVLDPPRSKLRALAASLDQHLSTLRASGAAADVAAVTEAWSNLSASLDLGVEPSLRACPHCQRRILDEATRCRYCMAASAAVRSSEPTP